MNKYIKIGAIVGGIWGFISSVFVMGGTLEPVGYYQYFHKASIIHWIIYFPGMVSAYIDYQSILGNRIGIFLILSAILIGVLLGILVGYLYGKFKK